MSDLRHGVNPGQSSPPVVLGPGGASSSASLAPPVTPVQILSAQQVSVLPQRVAEPSQGGGAIPPKGAEFPPTVAELPSKAADLAQTTAELPPKAAVLPPKAAVLPHTAAELCPSTAAPPGKAAVKLEPADPASDLLSSLFGGMSIESFISKKVQEQLGTIQKSLRESLTGPESTGGIPKPTRADSEATKDLLKPAKTPSKAAHHVKRAVKSVSKAGRKAVSKASRHEPPGSPSGSSSGTSSEPSTESSSDSDSSPSDAESRSISFSISETGTAPTTGSAPTAGTGSTRVPRVLLESDRVGGNFAWPTQMGWNGAAGSMHGGNLPGCGGAQINVLCSITYAYGAFFPGAVSDV